jgi:hypothetical protein
VLLFGDQSSSAVEAAATAAAHRQLQLYLTQSACTLLHSAADLAIGYLMTDTDVHGVKIYMLMRIIVN